MVTRNVAQLHSEEFSNDRAPGSSQGNIRTRAVHFRPLLPSAAQELYRSTELDRYSQDDYRIALVPHQSEARATGPRLELSATTQRMLVLPFTWRELLERVRRELNPATSGQSMTATFGEVRVDFLTMEISRGC